MGTFPFQPTGPAGAASARHSLRPLYLRERRDSLAKPGRKSHRGDAVARPCEVRLLHCRPGQARRRRARPGIHNHRPLCVVQSVCHLALSMDFAVWVLAFARTTAEIAVRASHERSPILTIFWHCGGSAFSSRKTLRRARQPSVNRFGREFPRHPRVWHADSQRYVGSSGRGRSHARDFRCVGAHPASRAPASYLPLRADWALAPGHSGVVRDDRTLSAPS